MSTYFKVWNSTISAPDPDTVTLTTAQSVGRMADGKPIVQGLEGAIAQWSSMTLAQWIDLWDRYNTNKNSTGTLVIPPRTSGGSWTTWRSVSAYADEPQGTYQGNNVLNVSMSFTIVIT